MTRRKDPLAESLQPEAIETETKPTAVDAAVDDVTVETAAPKPVAAPDPPVTGRPPPRSGLFGTLLGGAIAAVGGFALSHFNVLGLASESGAIPALTARLEEAAKQQGAMDAKLATDLANLADRIAKLESAPSPPPPDLSRLDSLDQRLAVIETIPTDGTASTAALTAKVAEMEQRLATLPAGGADPALQQKLDEALARLAEAEATATARAREADAAARAAAHAKALDALAAAIAAGLPYATELQALADPALTEALGPAAESGVPTLAQLQTSFPDAAREALRLARDLSTEDGWGDRLVDFLAAQTGARPLTPLEGDTPDAVLSRAEFALSEGRIADALAEIDSLDPAIKVPLDPWIAQAKAHLAAAAALQAARGE